MWLRRTVGDQGLATPVTNGIQRRPNGEEDERGAQDKEEGNCQFGKELLDEKLSLTLQKRRGIQKPRMNECE